MIPRSLVLGTAGHVDHGKTTLIHALTGTDPDRLPEEKARAMTIDLGFAAMTLDEVQVSFIDVPGHQAFLRNMMAGAAGLDAVLLIVAADEGPRPQTLEHLAICALLGVRHGIVVLTKQDAVAPERLAAAHQEAKTLTRETFLATSEIIAVSARTGTGLAALQAAILRLADHIPLPSTDRVLRLPLDRIFSIKGFGTVVTGTLHNGSVSVGDTLEVQPSSKRARVRGVQVHNRPVETAQAPTRAALNLAGIEVADATRGDTLVTPATLQLTSTIDVELTATPGAPPIKHRDRLGLYAFAYETEATVLLYSPESSLARLRLSTPLLLLPGDPFVLRRRSPTQLLGGGRVLDAHPLLRTRKPAALIWLQSVQIASPTQQLLARIERRGQHGVTLATLIQETGLTGPAIQQLLAPTRTVTAAIENPQADRFLYPPALDQCVAKILAELTRTPSLPIAALLSQSRVPAWVLTLAIDRLLATHPVQRVGADLTSNLHPAPEAAQAAALTRIADLYRTAALAPPLLQEAAIALSLLPRELTPLLTLLIRKGTLLRMGSDTLLMHADALADLKTTLVPLKGQSIDIARFKALTGLTRKHAIPLLEYLDGARITTNRAGLRTIL